jgi:hypothetical protein
MEVIHIPFEAIRTRVRGRFNATTISFPFRAQAVIRNPRLRIPKPQRFALPMIMGTAPFVPYIATIPIAMVRPVGKVISMKRSLIRAGKRDVVETNMQRLRARDFRLALRYLTERHDTVGNVAILPFILESGHEERIREQDRRFFRRTDWWTKY